MVSFQPLGDAKLRAFQFLIKLDLNDVNILVDTGWDESLSEDVLSELVDAIPSIDLILLTHATVGHTGAFCYLRHRYPQFRSIPTYATLPVVRMSQMMTVDVYRAAGLCGPFDTANTMSQEDVEIIWSEVHSLRYSQPLQLHSSPKLEGTMITAYNSGHSLGGSLWKISDGVDSVVVALDWNHARDAHLSGAFLESKTGVVVGDLQRPSLLITSTHVSSGLPLTKCRQQFLDDIDQALKYKGTVLIPTSNGSRILELILILEKHMRTNHKRVPLIYCSQTGKQMFSQASSMLEWMVPSIISDWQVQNESPFDTAHVHYCQDYKTISQRWPSGPKVVLSFGECLEYGPSKNIFAEMIAGDENSSVIINEICPPQTLGEKLLSLRGTAPGLAKLDTKLESVVYKTEKKLTGNALRAYNTRHETEKEEAVEAAAEERRNQQLIDTSAQTEDESSESEEELEDLNLKNDALGPNIFLHDEDAYDYEIEPSTNSPTEGTASAESLMFPFAIKRRRADDYGSYFPSGLFTSKSGSGNEKKENAETNPSQSKKTEPSSSEAVSEKKDADKPQQPAQEGKKKKEEHPMTVTVTRKNNLAVKCRIAYADMNGITNLRSLQMVVKQIQPERTVALPGSVDVCDALAKQCQKFAVGDKVVSFKRTNFSVDVRIDPSMSLAWHDLHGGFSVARVSGTLQFDPHDRIKKSGAMLTPSQDSPPTPAESQGNAHTTVGDLRLTSLRKLLNESGMKAEFKSQGILVCNESVLVRKTGDGSYVLEGGIDPTYYTVRAAIRRFIAIV